MARITTAHVDGAADQQKDGTKCGGWAVVLNHGERVLSGGAVETTNNRMELTAIRAAITATTGPLQVRSDSEWSVKAISGEYKIKENVETVKEIQELMVGRHVEIVWIPRNSEPSHERADGLAKRAKLQQIEELNRPQVEEPKGVELENASVDNDE